MAISKHIPNSLIEKKVRHKILSLSITFFMGFDYGHIFSWSKTSDFTLVRLTKRAIISYLCYLEPRK